jgi:hypothetical protein
MRALIPLMLLLAACSTPPSVVGWLGSDVHLVDGVWIGTETPCAAGKDGLECRVVVEYALATVRGSKVTKAALAALPSTFVLASGETRMGHLGGGIDTGRAVVLDFADGTRRVLGFVCYLPYAGDGSGLALSMVTCTWNPLNDWRDGNVPPSYPPGTEFS